MSQIDTQAQSADPWVSPAPTTVAAKPAREKRRLGDLVVVGLLSAGLASGGTYAVTRTSAGTPATATPVSQNAPVAAQAPVIQADGTAPNWTATAKAVSPSVVAIKVTSAQAEGEGSGVIIDRAGHILTNNHVATGAGSGAQISVTLDDGRTYAATVAGTDPSTDLAAVSYTHLTLPTSDLV